MILVTGATGQLGLVVIKHLVKQGDAERVAGLVRDERKAAPLKALGVEIRKGDYDDITSLDRAMNGVEEVLLISGTETDPAKSLQQHANVIDAAKRAGVRFIAYTGRAMKDPANTATELMRGHFETEDLIRASGLNYALFRNALYMDSISYFIGKRRPEPGRPPEFETNIRLPTADGRVAYALRSELGEAMANALSRDGREHRVYTLTASEAWSFEDMARTLSELSGHPVTYTPTDKATFEAQMRERGYPEAMAKLFSGFYSDIGDGRLDEVTPELEQLLGRKPASLKAGLKTMFSL